MNVSRDKRFVVAEGQKFGRLRIVEEVTRTMPNGTKRRAARCACDCGVEVVVLLQALRSDRVSCGCAKKRETRSVANLVSDQNRHRKLHAEPGQKFDRLTMVREYKSDGVWFTVCKCDCGNETRVSISNLVTGKVRSCGCLQQEHAARIAISRATHGLTDHPHYARWTNMRRRCDDPKDSHYKNYGERGIRIHDEWYDVAVFIAYLESELGPCPEGHSLDRIDNNKNYEPGNLRWADAVTQRHNQRRGTA